MANKKEETEVKRDKDGYIRKTFTVNNERCFIKAKTEDELMQKEVIKRIEAEKNNKIFNPQTTVKTWAAEYLETYVKPKVCEQNYKTYKRNIELHVLPFIGKVKMNDVKNSHLQGVLNKHAGESKSHLSHIKIAIIGMFTKAKKNNLITDNPAIGLDMPETYEGTLRSLTDTERKALLKVCETHYAGLWAKLILYCGLRPQETAVLTRDKINIDKAMIKVDKALAANEKRTKGPKTKAGNRLIPIPEHFLPELKAELIKQPFGLMFINRKGAQLSGNRMCKRWNSIKKKMISIISTENKVNLNINVIDTEIDELTAYYLRHTYCTDLEKAGVPLNIAKYLMGHEKIETTANIYTHKSDAVIETARKTINNYNNKSKCAKYRANINNKVLKIRYISQNKA